VTDHLLIFWIQLLVLLSAAHALGALARRAGQPPVVGALAAGLLLSPSVLGAISPDAYGWLFPDDPRQQGLLQGVAWIGVALLVLITGFETDLALVRRLGRAAALVAVFAQVIPFATGFGVGMALPAELLGDQATRVLFALFIATALSISALPVIARILVELDLMRRNFGQITLAAATADDVVGWVLLGAIAGAARSGSFGVIPIAGRFAAAALFGVFAFIVGQRLVDAALRAGMRRGAGVSGAVATSLLIVLLAGACTHALGLEAIFGTFVAGVLLGRSRYQSADSFPRIETLTSAFFAPLFFASAGVRADLSSLADPAALGWGLVVFVAASAAKFCGAFVGSRIAGLHPLEGLALGAALNARGAVGLVVATVGLGAGVLNQASYTIVVLISMATSMMAPPALRAIARRWQGGGEEQERLARERLHGQNLLVRTGRVLLPTHGGPNSLLAARILDLAWPEGTKVTVFSAGPDVPSADLRRVLSMIEKKPSDHVHSRNEDPLPAVLEQAALGYGAIVVGASNERIAGRMVSPFVDGLFAASPVPVLMIRRGVMLAQDDVPHFERVLVPAIATLPGRAAQEVAFGIAKRLGSEVLLAHIVKTPVPGEEMLYSRSEWQRDGGPPESEGDAPWGVARRVMDEAQALAREIGVEPQTAIRIGISAPREILSLSREAGADLIVLPANLRQLSERPFLGYGVEYILRNSESTVLIVSLPAGWRRA
jgi:Kef-type K+ transport system membrane component KefB/nucleotide-binding universal stress UspA family protein